MGAVGIFAEIAAHPSDSLASHHVIRVNQFVEAGNGGDVPADDDGRARRQPAHAPAHLTHLGEVGNDAGDAHDVIFRRGKFALEPFQGGEIEQRARCGNVLLNHHQAPGAMEHAQRKAALLARDLVVIQLHGIDGTAAEFVVARIWPEHRTQQHTRARPLRMGRDYICGCSGDHGSMIGTSRSRYCDPMHIEVEMTEVLHLQIFWRKQAGGTANRLSAPSEFRLLGLGFSSGVLWCGALLPGSRNLI